MTHTDVISTTTTDHGTTYRVRLEHDEHAGDPRKDHDHAATLVLRMRRHDLPLEGDLVREIDEAMDRGGFRLTARYLQTVHGAPVVLPVWGYDHGNLTFQAEDRVGQYTDRWDSGLAGLAYLSAEAVRTGWTDHGVDLTADELVEVLRSEIEEYNAWATGEVYGYIVERSTTDAGGWEEVDSCWGHIGRTWAVEAATDALTEAVQHGAAEYTLQQAAAAEDEAEIESLRLIEVGA